MENRDVINTVPVLKINVYPLPETLIKEFARGLEDILIVEDGYPYIETRIKTIVCNGDLRIRGKLTGDLPASGELNPDIVRKALGGTIKESAFTPSMDTVLNRPPVFCEGCGHRDVFSVLDEIRKELPDLEAFSDIGCYTLSALKTPPSIDSCVCMGASVGMAKGAANGGLKYSVGVIGDSTFLHSGIPTLVKAAGDNTPVTFIILDNSTTGMTGGQELPISGNRFELFLEGLGIPKEHIRVIDPRRIHFDKNLRIIREELEYRGVSVIIARRECIQIIRKTHKKQKAVNL
jgi:indolepyruvate ferredoxin oxidoreductase alpha subunit